MIHFNKIQQGRQVNKYVVPYMKKFTASSSFALVSGQSLTTFYHTPSLEAHLDILKPFGLDQIDPSEWYLQQTVLDVLQTIKDSLQDWRILIMVGEEIIQHAFQPNITTVQRALAELDTIHSMNHRDISPLEHIGAVIIDEDYAVAFNATPYPDDLIYGYLWGLMRKFAPEPGSVSITYEDNDQVNSDGEMKFHIRWGLNGDAPD